MIAAEQLHNRLAALLATAEKNAAIEKALAAGFVLNSDGSLSMAA
jgi:hypothetical protein